VDAKQLAKLIRQNAAKAKKVASARDGAAYDETLAVTRKPNEAEDDESIERDHFFKEMKRREF
jgi:tRNA uridine 5-carbamoylmethylation protein Kti12